ncbi:MAG: hypothetical protein VKM34_04425 [Cyanobacteriota bacterium]|nr:hypothetical protein [Cyanobacteriota bacterium]
MDRQDRPSELAFELIGALMQRNNPADRPLLLALTSFLLKQELEALLQRPVDLVRLRERMNPALRQAILQEGVCA